MLIYKINAINNIIKKESTLIKKIYILKKNKKSKDLIKKCLDKNIKIYYVNKIKRKELNYIKQTHIAFAVVIKKIFNLKNIIKTNNVKLLILDRIQDPYNLSACIRTAEAAKVTAVITSNKESAKISSLINSISNGASILIPIINEINIEKTIKELKKKNIKIIGLSVKTNKIIKKENFIPPVAILMGSEKDGIKNSIKEECDEILKIDAEKSINVSVATGIALFI